MIVHIHLKLSLHPLRLSFPQLHGWFLPSSVALHSVAASALCAPLSLRGSPLIALHITLNHHNNKSTLLFFLFLSPANHLEGQVLKILRLLMSLPPGLSIGWSGDGRARLRSVQRMAQQEQSGSDRPRTFLLWWGVRRRRTHKASNWEVEDEACLVLQLREMKKTFE